MYLLIPQSGRPLAIDDKAVPNTLNTACGRMFAEFLAENAIRWESRFPLLFIDDDEQHPERDRPRARGEACYRQ